MKHRIFKEILEREYNELEIRLHGSLEIFKKTESLTTAEREINALHAQEYPYAGAFLVYHSLFSTAYSFMEYSLRKFSELAAAELERHVRRVSEFEKSYQYYYFLIDELKLDPASLSMDWERLNIFRDIRNSIVHYNSTIGKNISSSTYAFIKSDPRIQFEEPRFFYIKDEALIVELLTVSRRFLISLIDEFDKSYFQKQS